MNGMMLHRGALETSRQELDLIPLPDASDTYTPVSHYELSDRLLTISRDILTDYALVGEKYAVARQGNQLFALLTFKRDSNEMGLSVAFRNSYDRSMSVGMAIGANVFVCDNLSLSGDIVIMRKHTKNIWNVLEDLAISTLYKSQKSFEKVIADSERLKALPMNDMDAAHLMGELYFAETISPRQLTVVRDEWLKPSHEEFQPRNRWSFFNAVTESLKTTPPTAIMERHREAYKRVIEVST